MIVKGFGIVQQALITPKPKPYWRFERAIDYMWDEMTSNIWSEPALAMKRLNAIPLFISPPAAIAAISIFFYMVNDDAAWEHKQKKKLPTILDLPGTNFYFPFPDDDQYEYYYDIWSNVHYGYVGTIVGFSPSILQGGGVANDLSKLNFDWNDINAINIGIDLANRYGTSLSKENLRQALLNKKDKLSRQRI